MSGTEVQASAFSAMAVTYGLERLKRAQWFPWLKQSGGRVNAIVAALAAAGATIGVHWTYDPAAGSLIVTGLTLAGIGAGVLEFGKQWLLQQFVFDAAVRGKGGNDGT